MSKEAMKLALEALELVNLEFVCANGSHHAKKDRHEWDEDCPITNRCRKAITVLQEALAEQPAQQEPVVWMYVNKSTHETKFQKHMRDFVDHSLWSEVPLYGEPLANHELQCVCGAVWLGDELVHLPDKRPPAQRTWVGLTDEEAEEVWKQVEASDFRDCVQPFAQTIEAKLKEKNT